MTIARATCDGCQDIEISVSEVQVRICASTNRMTFSFQCPICRLLVIKPASERHVVALTRAGAQITMWTMPAELDESKQGPPITHDDLLGFHCAVESEDFSLAVLTTL